MNVTGTGAVRGGLRRIVRAGALGLALAASAGAEEATYRFTARVGETRLAGSLVEQGEDPKNMISYLGTGLLMRPPLRIDLADDRARYAEPLETLIRYQRAWRAGAEVERLLQYWHPASRERLRPVLAGADRAGALFKGDRFSVLAVMRMGEERIVLGGRAGWVISTVLRQEQGQWYLVERSAQDPAVALMEAALAKGTVTRLPR